LDPSTIPSLWSQWLSYRRENPPTEDEIQRIEVQLQKIREKAKQIDDRDQKLRLQELADRGGAPAPQVNSDPEYFQAYVTKHHEKEEALHKDSKGESKG